MDKIIQKFSPSLMASWKSFSEHTKNSNFLKYDENVFFYFLLSKKHVGIDLILDKAKVDKPSLIRNVSFILEKKAKKNDKEPTYTRLLSKILHTSLKISQELDDDIIYPEYILAAFVNFIEENELLQQIMESFDKEILVNAIQDYCSDEGDEFSLFLDSDEKSEDPREVLDMLSNNPILSQFADNLNIRASEGRFDNLVDFNNSIDELTSILCRKQKSNVIIVGDPGVGKTSIVTNLALQIVSGKAPPLLSSKVIYSVNLGSMLAGTQYRGQFEERLQMFIEESRKYNNLILFFDEIHTLMGAGTGSSETNSLDASNMLKPYLTSGELSVIGATTINEYKNTIKKDGALDRRFEVLIAKQPNAEQMMDIFKSVKKHYEYFHKVEYSEEILRKILIYCDRYLPLRNYPDKAIDVLDQVGAICKREQYRLPDEIKSLEDELHNSKEGYNEELLDKFTQRLGIWAKEAHSKITSVTENHLYQFFRKKGNPVLKVFDEGFYDDFIKNICGQKRFLIKFKSIIDGIKYGILDKKHPNSPRSFFVNGYNGTGKTLIANLLRKSVENVEGNCIHISGLEYADHNFQYKFFGHPGIKSNNSVCEQVLLQPNSLIIIDSIEQCGYDFFCVLQRILLDGKIQSANGENVDFSNTFLFFFNTATAEKREMGFNSKKSTSGTLSSDPSLLSIINASEFKLDLEKLSEKAVCKILCKRLKEIRSRLREAGIDFSCSKQFIKQVSKMKTERENNGARFISSIFSDRVEPFLLGKLEDNSEKIRIERDILV